MPYKGQSFILLLLLISNSALAQQGGHILERSVYSFPSWDIAIETTLVDERHATKEEYIAAVKDGRYVFEEIIYNSDGLEVVAYLYSPKKKSRAKNPVIVFNRWGYILGDIAPVLLPMFHRLAKEGFTIVAPMYRGSAGGEGRDELGGADLNDLMNIVGLLSELKSVDTNNVFLYGESRGSLMVYQAIKEGFPARAAATYGGFTDFDSLVTNDPGGARTASIFPNFDVNRTEIVARRSAVQWAEEINIPLLLMHGSNDGRISPTHTLNFAKALEKAQKDYGVIVYAGGKHVMDEQRVERDQDVTEFFKRYIAN